MSDDKKLAGQIIGPGVAIKGETLADVLDIDTWTEIRDGKVVKQGKSPIIIATPQAKK